jgi:hypothetical protein
VPPVPNQIAPTATTCADFRDGNAGDLSQVLYSLNGAVPATINNVAPGVFFYYTHITSTATTVSITQSDNGTTPAFEVQKGQAVVYNATSCNKSTACTVDSTDGQVSFSCTAGSDVIIGVKYSTKSVVGSPEPTPTTVTYTFTTVNGGIPVGSDTLDLAPKP